MEVPIQVISDAPRVDFRRAELAAAGEDAIAALLERLEGGGSLSCALAPLPDGRWLLVIALPVLLADPRSLDNLAAEVARAYDAETGGGPGEPEDEPLQYAQFADWQNEILEDAEAVEAQEFWDRQTVEEGDAPVPPAAAQGGGVPARLTFAAPAGTLAAVERTAGEHGASVEAFLLTCWGALLAPASPAAPRSLSTCSSTAASLPSWRRLSARSSARSTRPARPRRPPILPRPRPRRGPARRGAQAQELFREAGAERRAPAFAWEGEPAGTETGGGVRFTVLDKLWVAGGSPLTLWARRRGGELALELLHNPTVHDGKAACRPLAERFLTLVASALAGPGRPLDELELIGPAERARLAAWSLRPAEPPAETLPARSFAAQAARTPEALAVAAGARA